MTEETQQEDANSTIRRLSYAETLCITMLRYTALHCKKTEDFKASEIKEKLEFFFDKEMIDDMVKIIVSDNQDIIFTSLTP